MFVCLFVCDSFIGFLATRVVGHIFNDPLSEITVTLVACYASFVAAEGTDLRVSGVLAVVATGLHPSDTIMFPQISLSSSSSSFWRANCVVVIYEYGY